MYSYYPDMLDEGHIPLPDITVGNAFVFLCADLAQSEGNNERLPVHTKTVFTAFYTKAMTRDTFLHIPRFLIFSNNKNEPDKNR
jgi:hypothetical protein